MEVDLTNEGSTLLTFFKAMGNESRLKIVGFLAERERSVQELAGLLGLKEPTVSHHLAMLKALGLVSARPDGNTHWHTLNLEVLRNMNRTLLDNKNVVALAQSKADPEKKILSGYLDGEGRLKSIPASDKKRFVVLKWLVAQFEENHRYRESEVNETIQLRHWDSATLRRELVGHRMMGRKQGVYWRTPRTEWKQLDPAGRC
jgi:hypothetical protein